MSFVSTPQKYPTSLSQGEGGPSRRPVRNQYPIPSIDDVLPSPPLNKFPPAQIHAAGGGGGSGQAAAGKGGLKMAKSAPLLKKSASRPLNPNSKPYTPQQFRQPPPQQPDFSAQSFLASTDQSNNHYHSFGVYPSADAQYTQYPTLYAPEQQTTYPFASDFSTQHQQSPHLFSARPQYSSLQHLLEQAGYAHTRIDTPPAEKSGRRIKKTFDEVDAEEVRDLYSTFGMAGEHRVSHITEPGLPFKSSSSILRNLAMQDSIQHGVNTASPAQAFTSRMEPRQEESGAEMSASYDKWWRGGLDALGRAAKAVMEMSPPSKANDRFEEMGRQASVGLGLGLARGGEGVRKVKSNWELGQQWDARDERDQEQIPPVPDHTSPPTIAQRRSAVVAAIDTAGPPRMVEDEEFGYSPLPADYETQCDDDDLFATSFDVGSLASVPSEQNSPDLKSAHMLAHGVESPSVEAIEETDADAADAVNVDADLTFPIKDDDSVTSGRSYKSLGFGFGQYELTADVGKRIMASAVEYDDVDEDSPTKKPARPVVGRSHTTPPPPALIFPAMLTGSPKSSQGSSHMENTENQPMVPVRKYADRAAKLRQARSTPQLTRPAPVAAADSWYGSIKNYIFAPPTEPCTAIPAEPLPTSSKPAPLRLSPALPAAPTLASPTAVICDSTSDLAEDLPAIPSAITVTEPSGTISSIAIRTRRSLAQLRSTWIGGPAPPVPALPVIARNAGDKSPVLSPRMDLSESEAFAGWSPNRIQRSDPADQDGYGPTEIDYTKSFFYKPATPPSASATGYQDEAQHESAGTNGGLVARRQRSIKSLRAALLLPVAPPVPALPSMYANQGKRSSSSQTHSTVSTAKTSPELATPPLSATSSLPEPPVLAILSPGAWEAGLPPRELVLEGEEWDARDGSEVGRWSRKGSVEDVRSAGKVKGKGKKLKRKGSKKAVTAS